MPEYGIASATSSPSLFWKTQASLLYVVIYKALQGWMQGSKEGEAKTRDGKPLSLSELPCLETGRSLSSPSNFETILW